MKPKTTEIEFAMEIHIGKEIEDELRSQERGVTWFAQKLNYDRSNIYKIFHRRSIDTDTLLRISRILNRNFFTIYIEALQQEDEEEIQNAPLSQH